MLSNAPRKKPQPGPVQYTRKTGERKNSTIFPIFMHSSKVNFGKVKNHLANSFDELQHRVLCGGQLKNEAGLQLLTRRLPA